MEHRIAVAACLTCDRGPKRNTVPWCRNCIYMTGSSKQDDMSKKPGTYKRGHRVYIAGPFFNPQQVAEIELIEAALGNCDVPYFSPFREGGLVGDTPNDQSAEIFCIDFMGIVHCEWVLAICTYEGVSLKAAHSDSEVNIPDTGTVWEMGAAFSLGKPVVGYFPKGRMPKRMNLMLTEAFVDIVEGDLELQEYVLGTHRTRSWQGRIT